jgi:membrane-associated protease RseP (regulator of RpoE activity)
MKYLIISTLALSFAAPASGQSRLIVRQQSDPDRMSLDSTQKVLLQLNNDMRSDSVHRVQLSRLDTEMRAQAIKLRQFAAGRYLADTFPLALAELRDSAWTLKGLEQPLARAMAALRRQPHIGITIDYTPRETDKFGAYVLSVTPGSPADRAGILSGDVIVRVAGKPVASATARPQDDETSLPGVRLSQLIAALPVGRPAEIALRRGNDSKTVHVTPTDNDPVIANRTMPIDRLSGSVAFGELAPMIREQGAPAIGNSYNGLFTATPGAPWGSTYTFVNGLFGDFELAPLNAKLGSYFGTDEGVLVVNTVADRPMPASRVVLRGGASPGAGRLDTVVVTPRVGGGFGGFGGGGGAGRVARIGGGGGAGGRLRTDTGMTYLDGVPVTPQERGRATLGLEPGDVIVSVDGRKVTTPSQLMRIVASYDRGDEFKLQIMRQKRAETLNVKMP